MKNSFYILNMKYKMLLVSTPKGEYIFTSVKEVATFLGVSTSSVYYYMKKGSSYWKITPYYFESGKKVLPENILAWYKK